MSSRYEKLFLIMLKKPMGMANSLFLISVYMAVNRLLENTSHQLPKSLSTWEKRYSASEFVPKYRVTIPLVPNLPLTSKQKLRFGLAWPTELLF